MNKRLGLDKNGFFIVLISIIVAAITFIGLIVAIIFPLVSLKKDVDPATTVIILMVFMIIISAIYMSGYILLLLLWIKSHKIKPLEDTTTTQVLLEDNTSQEHTLL
jgi:ABC-type multidrug transport system permease subunit